MRKWVGLTGVLAAAVAAHAVIACEDWGQGRFFADQTHHFQALRALSDVAAEQTAIQASTWR